MLTREQNELLCRVEGNAPMGGIMRRHWLPACMSEEVAERDGAPVRSRLLGENLVVFRDTNGRLGALSEYCLHRRASLAFGRNEECGLCCLYHGWTFDVDGNVVRKPIKSPETHQYVRTTLFIAPFTVLIPPNNRYNLAQMLVPIDDVNTMFYWIAWHADPAKGISQDAWRKFCAAEVGVDIDQNYRRIRTLANNFLQDREAMKRGDWTGIKGIPAQDMAMWESMGPITDRAQDHVGSSDLAVAQFRRMMVAAAKKFAEGGAAIGTSEHTPHAKLASFEGVVPKALDWRTLGTPADESVTAK